MANTALVNTLEFEAKCLTQSAYAAISDIVDYSSTSGTLSINIPPEYLDLSVVFLEGAAYILPEYGSQDLCLEASGTPPFRRLYNFSQVEQEGLQEYLAEKQVKEFIQLSSLSAGALVLFVKK